ncbi:hypothetical protein N6G05_26805 [Cupriavidus gilardii]|uniref:hypothetical protein n=1 Tax=Cupriavidus gilardii TaxID=82541 RepID=UPI0021C0ACB0|nr:hypothetical protein [Cupriavidus gilardii]MCT9017166.1 hypothetical protein [Cupriavidus gilardii]MCT9056829.1 hypothetical protein [Cupriavidus gilardii]
MTTIYVQFADETEEVIVSYFGIPQDPDYWKNQGTVESSDPRWKAYYESMASLREMGVILPEPTEE